MPKPFEITGLTQLQAQIAALPQHLKDEVSMELEASAQTIAADAKRNAPVDIGGLQQGISSKKVNDLTFEVVSLADYSAYVEFGTGARVSIPAGYEAFAAQYRGKAAGRTGLASFFERILDWVKHKGIAGTYSVKTQRRKGSKATRDAEDKQVAYAIMWSIFHHGSRPHPFLIPAYEKEKVQLIKRVTAIVNNVK